MNTIKVRIQGISPLLMHSAAGVDPLHPLNKQKKALTDKKRNKTDEDHAEVQRLDFILSLYHDGERPVVPENNIVGMLVGGARRRSKGQDVLSAVMISPDQVPLEYDGPRDPEKLYHTDAFRDVRPAGVKTSRVMRCRPRFNKWALTFDIHYDPKIISETTLRDAIDAAASIGLCDYTPRFGRFEVTEWTA